MLVHTVEQDTARFTARRQALAVERAARADWRAIAVAQEHVLARSQALAGGMTADAWQWAHERGRFRRLLPGVSLVHGGQPIPAQCAWAAVLHCGDGAALTGDTALVLHGMRFLSPPPVVSVAVPAHRVVRPGAVVSAEVPLPVIARRTKDLHSLVHPLKRPPVLRLPVAVAHAASGAPTPRAAEWRLAAVVQQRLTTAAHVRAVVADLPKLPRRALLLAVLDEVEGGVHARSELDFVRLLDQHRLPRPDRLQRAVRADGKRYLDAWWERQRVAVEVDGAHHLLVEQWDADVLRANEVVVVERHDRLLLLRFTSGNLRHDGPQVVRQLERALDDP